MMANWVTFLGGGGAAAAVVGTGLYLSDALPPVAPRATPPAEVAALPEIVTDPVATEAPKASEPPVTEAAAPDLPEDKAKPEPAVAAKPEPEQIVLPDTETKDAVMVEDEVDPPSFDLVRIDPDGAVLVAGQGKAKALIRILLNEVEISRTETGRDGKFVSLFDLAPSEQPRLMTLAMLVEGKEFVSDTEIIVAPFQIEQRLTLAEEPLEAGAAVKVPAPVAEPGAEESAAAPLEVVTSDDTPTLAIDETIKRAAAVTPEPELPAEDGQENVSPDVDPPKAKDVIEPGEAVAGIAQAEGVKDQTGAPKSEQKTPVESPEVAGTAEVAAGIEDVAQKSETANAEEDVAEAVVAEPPAEDPIALVAVDVAALDEVDSEITTPAEEEIQATPPAKVNPEVAEIEEQATEVAEAGAREKAETNKKTEPVEEFAANVAGPDPKTSEVPEAIIEPQPGVENAEPEPAEEIDEAKFNPVTTTEADAPSQPEADRPPVLLASDQQGVRILAAPEVLDSVAIDTISYDDKGDVALAGRGVGSKNGGFVRVYLDNTPITTSRIREDGSWLVKLPEVDKGVYTLRVDEVDVDGKVKSRAETPFQREDREILERVAGAENGSTPLRIVTVQPGNTLWQIARDRYGEGLLYVRVFDANRKFIRNPDLIYPGQVFDLPIDSAQTD